MKIPSFLTHFFFDRQSAAGFGLMRIVWAALVLITFIVQGTDLLFFYSDQGLMNPEVSQAVLRTAHRFSATFLHSFSSPSRVHIRHFHFLSVHDARRHRSTCLNHRQRAVTFYVQ